MEQDGLAAVPFEPQAAVEDDLGEQDEGDPPVVEGAADALGVDLLALFVKGDFDSGLRLRAGFWLAHWSSCRL
ncbi:hypothetical protein SDC9_210466 [bioreactor metagenome]|uniref:Uncharacterized protein n=1 Tax=bioreactor metagenome TaxID=1076179 RepID=A0A645JTX1_9ZZZZ